MSRLSVTDLSTNSSQLRESGIGFQSSCPQTRPPDPRGPGTGGLGGRGGWGGAGGGEEGGGGVALPLLGQRAAI